MTFEPGQKVIYYALTRREVRPVECTVVRLDDDPAWLVIRSPEKRNPIRVKKTSVQTQEAATFSQPCCASPENGNGRAP